MLSTEICSKLLGYFIVAFLIWKYFVRSDSRLPGYDLPARLSSWNPIYGPGTFVENFLLAAKSQLVSVTEARFYSFGPTYETSSFGIRTFHTKEPQNLQAIFSTHASDWGVAPQRYPVREVVGSGVITSDGAHHDLSRTLLKPSFEGQSIEDFSVTRSCITQLLGLLPADGSVVDLQPLLLRMHLDVSSAFILGENLGTLTESSNADAEDFRISFEAALRGAGLRMALGPLGFILPRKDWLKSCRKVHSFVDQHVERSIESQQKHGTSEHQGLGRPRSLLHRLTESTSDKLEIRQQVLGALMGSLENVALLQSNCVFVLARRPDLWLRLKEEVESVADNDFSVNTLRSLSTMREFVDETLRVFPILFRATRRAICDTSLPTGGGPNGDTKIFIPKGSVIQPYLAHVATDTQIWGPDAKEFNPDRWKTFKPQPWQFMPFGGGTRACLAKQKTLLDTYYFLALLLQQFDRVESRDAEPWTPSMKITVRSGNGCKVGFFKNS